MFTIKDIKTMIIITETGKKNKWNIVENYIKNDKTILHLKYKDMTLKDYAKQREKQEIDLKNITED